MQKIAVLMVAVCVVGCSGHITIRSHEELPNDPKQLREFVAETEAKIEGLEEELEEAKLARDDFARIAESADGYFERDDASRRLFQATARVSFIADDITYSKQQLAKAEARLKSSESGYQEASDDDGTAEP